MPGATARANGQFGAIREIREPPLQIVTDGEAVDAFAQLCVVGQQQGHANAGDGRDLHRPERAVTACRADRTTDEFERVPEVLEMPRASSREHHSAGRALEQSLTKPLF